MDAAGSWPQKLCALTWEDLVRHFVGMGFPGGLDKESACNVGDPGLIPGSGRSLEEGNGYHSSLDNLMDRRAPWTGQL